MKKAIITNALALVALSAGAQTQELPYLQDFSSGFGDMTVINKDESSPTFITTQYNGYSYGPGISYTGSADYTADDYIVSPALNIEAGKVYTVTLMYKSSTTGRAYNVSIAGGSSPENIDETLIEGIEISNGYSFETFTGKFTATTSGIYHIAMHVTSEAGTGSVYFDNFEVSAGVAAKAPASVTDLMATAGVANEKYVVDLACRAPLLDFGGNALQDPMSVIATRNDGKEIYTASGIVAGTEITFTDTEPLETSATYTVMVYNDFGESPKAEANVTPVFAAPMAVTGLTATLEDNNIIVKWDAVDKAASDNGIFIAQDVRYTVQRNIGTTKTVVAENIAETTFTDPANIPESGQDAVSYSVTAWFKTKAGKITASNQVIVGNPYSGEYAESFANYSYQTKTWTTTPGSSVWSVGSSSSYNPACDAQDGDEGLLKAQNTGTEHAQISSPYINVGELKNPRLDFYVYQDNSMTYDNKIEVMIQTADANMPLGNAIAVNGGEKGWNKFEFFLPQTVKDSDFRIVFDASPGGYAYVCIDNITIKDILDNNLAVTELAVPSTTKPGDTISLDATIVNKGANTAEAFNMEFYANDSLIGTADGTTIEAGSSKVISLPFEICPQMASKTLAFTATVVWQADQSDIDNSITANTEVNTNNYPLPKNLTATAGKGTVSLTWERPEISTEAEQTSIAEGFDEWTSGSTTAEKGWIFIDADGVNAKGIGGVNSNTPMAAMVAENVSYYEAHSGTKMLGISRPYSFRDTSDEWIVSPEVIGGQTVTFYVASYSSYGYPYYDDEYTLHYSTGGTTPEDFLIIGETRKIKSQPWVEVSFELPVDATRFAIHTTKIGNDGLLLDDFNFIQGVKPLQLKGYNIYRDGKKIATTDGETTSFSDAAVETEKEYTYTVSAIYDRGESLESAAATTRTFAYSNNLTVETLEIEGYTTPGNTVTLKANIANKGAEKAGNYKVNFKLDGETIVAYDGADLASLSTEVFTATYNITLAMTGKKLTFSATVDYEADEEEADNTKILDTDITANNFPAPREPAAKEENGCIILTWLQPEEYTDGDPITLIGYNIYRNGTLLTHVEAGTTVFIDEDTEEGITYSYTITAVYDKGETPETEPVSCVVTSVSGINTTNISASRQYNMAGQRVDKSGKGIRIIRRADGSTRKVMVR